MTAPPAVRGPKPQQGGPAEGSRLTGRQGGPRRQMEAKHQTKQPSLGHHGAEEPTCLPGQLPQGASCDPQDPERRGSVSHPQPTPNSPIRLEPAATTECAEKKGLVPGVGGKEPELLSDPQMCREHQTAGAQSTANPPAAASASVTPRGRRKPPAGLAQRSQSQMNLPRVRLARLSSVPLPDPSAPLPTTHRRVQGFQASAALCPTPGVGG